MRAAAWVSVALGIVSASLVAALVVLQDALDWRMPDWLFGIMMLSGMIGAVMAIAMRSKLGPSRLLTAGMLLGLLPPLLVAGAILFLVLNKAH